MPTTGLSGVVTDNANLRTTVEHFIRVDSALELNGRTAAPLQGFAA